jgi:hypothetical protein
MFLFVNAIAVASWAQTSPVPCANCNGAWTDNYQNIWTLDTNWSISDSAITGRVAAIAPVGCTGFTVVNYSVSGSLTRTPGHTNPDGTTTAGQTTFTIAATNPDRQSQGSCKVSTNTQYTGNIWNGQAGCNYGNGTWSNSFGQNGAFSWTKNCLMPNGNPTEVTFPFAWDDAEGKGTAYLWKMQIGASSDFAGRNATEQQGGLSTDSCYFNGSQVPMYGLTGGGWYVGYLGYNLYGYDLVGWLPNAVTYYRNAGKAPCSATVSQEMYLFCYGSPYIQRYKINNVFVGIDKTSVSSGRDAQLQVRTWQ